ncbi:MAG: prolipoprotein diacylglyceryl transferase [Trueperaceae bacterium]
MDPILVTIGPLALRWYGVLIALGVVAGAAWTLRAAAARGLDGEWLLDMAPWMVGAGIVGARLVYVLTSPSAYFGPGGEPLRAFAVWEGGISIHGGIIGIVAVLAWQARRKGYDVWRYLDVLSPIAAFGIIGGRIGNLMNGTDTGGRLTSWPIGFPWPEAGTPTFGAFGRVVFGDPLWQYAPPVCRTVPAGEPCVVHLTPIYGMLVGVLLIGVIAWALARTKTPGAVFLHMVLWYSVLRAVIEEPFRDNPLFWSVYLDPVGGVGLFTLTQLVSVPIVLVAAYLLWTRGAKA